MGWRSSIAGRLAKAINYIDKSYTETTTRPSVAQPYMSTDTGAKLPIFPFPLTMIYELADNIDALRIPIETLNREMFKNGFEVVEKWKYKCGNCSKEFQYAPTPDNPDDQPFEANGDNFTSTHPRKKKANTLQKLECDTCGSNDLARPVPEHRKTLEALMNYRGTHFYSNESGPIATVYYLKKIIFDKNSNLLNKLGVPYKIVHQYDKRWNEFYNVVEKLKKRIN